MIKVVQKFNEIFTPLLERKTRYYILIGGRGAGRSTAVSQYILSKLLAKDFFRCAIMREIASDIRSTVWQEFLDRVQEQNLENVLDIADSTMTAEYGINSIHAHGFRQSSGQHSAKLKSLANYNTVVIEEAKEVAEPEFMQLDDSLRTVKGDIKVILLLNPPPKSHWIIKRWFDCVDSGVKGFYNIKLKDGITDTVFLGGTFLDNLANLDDHTIKRYQEYKAIKPDYYYQEIAGLVPEVVRGKIYSGWQQLDSVPKEARLVCFGMDFGWFPDEAAVVAVHYWNGGDVLDEVAYGNWLTNAYLAGEIKKYGTAVTIADSAEPKSIEEIKKHKIRIEGADKEKGSVEFGIKTVSEKKIFVTRRSENIWREYENYAWDEDKEGNSKNRPAHQYSHSMDAIRYALAGQQSAVGSGVKVSAPKWGGYGKTMGFGKGVRLNLPVKQSQEIYETGRNVDWPKGF